MNISNGNGNRFSSPCHEDDPAPGEATFLVHTQWHPIDIRLRLAGNRRRAVDIGRHGPVPLGRF